MSLLPVPFSAVVNKPYDFLLLFSVQSQTQQLFRPAYPVVPLASVLCINICLHQWWYCTDCEAVEGGRECPQRCVCYCFPALLRDPAAQRHCASPPSWAPPILLFACCPSLTMHHSALLLSSSSSCHRLLFVFFFFLRRLSSPLPRSRLLAFPPRMSAHCLTFFLVCPVHL